jgi:hypothetical protein
MPSLSFRLTSLFASVCLVACGIDGCGGGLGAGSPVDTCEINEECPEAFCACKDGSVAPIRVCGSFPGPGNSCLRTEQCETYSSCLSVGTAGGGGENVGAGGGGSDASSGAGGGSDASSGAGGGSGNGGGSNGSKYPRCPSYVSESCACTANGCSSDQIKYLYDLCESAYDYNFFQCQITCLEGSGTCEKRLACANECDSL